MNGVSCTEGYVFMVKMFVVFQYAVLLHKHRAADVFDYWVEKI